MIQFLQFYFIMFILALIVNGTMRLFVDFISDIDPDLRYRLPLTLSALFWWITIPFNIIALIYYSFELIIDFFKYTSRVRIHSTEERAKRYKAASDKLHNKHISKSDFPADRGELFQTVIVNNLYCWKLVRFIGRVEEYADLKISSKIKMEIEEEERADGLEKEEDRIKNEFSKLIK